MEFITRSLGFVPSSFSVSLRELPTALLLAWECRATILCLVDLQGPGIHEQRWHIVMSTLDSSLLKQPGLALYAIAQ